MLQHSVVGWLVGLLGVSVVLGSICTWAAWRGLRAFFEATVQEREWVVPPEQTERIPIQPILIGILERIFFTVLVAFAVSGVATAMIVWVGAKMASGWNRIVGGGETWRRMLAFNGLMSSLISLLFAVVGGLIANGNIPLR